MKGITDRSKLFGSHGHMVEVRGWLRRSAFLALILALAGLLLGPVVARHARAGALLKQALGMDNGEGLADWVLRPVNTRMTSGLEAWGVSRVRLYSPEEGRGLPGLVLIHGVHAQGIEEVTFCRFARAMSAAGVVVQTPELVELTRHRIRPTTVGAIGASASQLARELGRSQVGVMGISFGGGLALLAAADPDMGRAIGVVVTLGAHHDLLRLAAHYAGETTRSPAGEVHRGPPKRFGLLTMFHAYAEQFFEAEEQARAQRALAAALRGMRNEANAIGSSLSPQGQQVLSVMLGDPVRAGRLLMDGVQRNQAALRALSPSGKLSGLPAATFLLHGADDPVIPAVETQWLKREVPAAALQEALVTTALSHTDRRGLGAKARDPEAVWRLVSFTAHVLGELEKLE
ncbi:MAG: hypothetical protein MJD61_04780 [Proteobacteria bacterium]|nr:hypothetical protein [Pseudomonadota bacterium]